MNQIFAALIFATISCCNVFAQVEENTALDQDIQEVKILRNFEMRYNQRLATMIRVYPLALSAKKTVEAHQESLQWFDTKRKKKKLGKQTHKELEDEFSYNIRDLYRSEGALLIRLVHRETGMTVADIIELFEGKARRKWYNGLAKIGGQNLESKYDPKGDDYLTELIISEIEAGTIAFNTEVIDVDKAEYKEGMKQYRADRKDVRQYTREKKKDARKAERKKN